MRQNFSLDFRANVVFGAGSIQETGKITAKFGKSAMVVTCPWPEVQTQTFSNIIDLIRKEGIAVTLYDKVTPNPTTSCIEEATQIAKEQNIDVVIGLGGGSAIDTAKGVSLGFAHGGGIWNYTYAAKKPYPIFKEKLLPVIAITTTSGTGSHITPYIVLQDPGLQVKTCVVADIATIPSTSIVDPDLMESLPAYITATTGFDVFAHAFEAYSDDNTNPLIGLYAIEAIRITVEYLARVYKNGNDKEARYHMAFADTLAGMCITLNNTTMPHDIGQAIVGKCPHITHGQSLAIIYPQYIKLALPSCEKKFAKIARLFDPELDKVSDSIAAPKLRDFIVNWQKEIGIYASGNSLKLPESIMDTVIDETVNNCSFVTKKIGLNREQISDMIKEIWSQ